MFIFVCVSLTAVKLIDKNLIFQINLRNFLKKIEKILTYIGNQSITEAEFERKSGISNGYLRNTQKRGADVTEKILEKVKKSNPGDYYNIFIEEKKGPLPAETAKANQEPAKNHEYLDLYIQSILEQKRILEEQNQFLRRNFEFSLNSIAKGQDAALLQLKTLAWFQADTRAGGDQKKVAEQLERMGNKAIELAGISGKKDIPSGS